MIGLSFFGLMVEIFYFVFSFFVFFFLVFIVLNFFIVMVVEFFKIRFDLRGIMV